MQIKLHGKERSYKSQAMLADVVKRMFGEDEAKVHWVSIMTLNDRWTAVVFLPEDQRWRMRQVAQFGFQVCG